MKVKQLIEKLKKCDPDRIVILSSDGEGNSFSPLMDVSGTGFYSAESSYSGDYSPLEKLTPSLKKEGYTEEDIIEGKKAVCLYPIN